MKTLGKTLVTGAVFLGGYFIGFYEYKYRMQKLMFDVMLKKMEEAQK